MNTLLAVISTCYIVYANDMGPNVTREIRNHEYAHCNGWEHPKGFDPATGYKKAFVPPKKYLKKFSGRLIEFAMSSNIARQMCLQKTGSPDLGCAIFIYEK